MVYFVASSDVDDGRRRMSMSHSKRTNVDVLKVTLRFFGTVWMGSEASSSLVAFRLGLRGGSWVALVVVSLASVGGGLVASAAISESLAMLMVS